MTERIFAILVLPVYLVVAVLAVIYWIVYALIWGGNDE